MISYWIFALIGFCSGSIMFSYLIPKRFYHVNIVLVSDDKNPGASNAIAHCGKLSGMICLVLDLLKGAVPTFFAVRQLDINNPLFAVVVVAPVLGHAFTPMLRFKGGKAIAVSFGTLLGLLPYNGAVFALAIPLIVFTFVIKIYPHAVRIIVCALLFAIWAVYGQPCASVVWACIAMAGILLLKHIESARNEPLYLQTFGRKFGPMKKVGKKAEREQDE